MLIKERDEEEAYRLVVKLLNMYPACVPGKPNFHHYELNSRYWQIAPRMRDVRSYLFVLSSDGNDISLAESSLFVIKRLFEEGKAFKNLKEDLINLIDDPNLLDNDDRRHQLSACRILYRLFPSLLSDHRSTIGSECVAGETRI